MFLARVSNDEFRDYIKPELNGCLANVDEFRVKSRSEKSEEPWLKQNESHALCNGWKVSADSGNVTSFFNRSCSEKLSFICSQNAGLPKDNNYFAVVNIVFFVLLALVVLVHVARKLCKRLNWQNGNGDAVDGDGSDNGRWCIHHTTRLYTITEEDEEELEREEAETMV